MSTDRSSIPPSQAEHRSSAIDLARAQVDAARQRERKLLASGRLNIAAETGSSGVSLPGYTLLGPLHRGGQGTVYLAVQESTNRHVAVKVLHRPLPGTTAGAMSLARFEREIEILSRLKHPNIVTVHDCGRERGHVYLVMDYVAGLPLDTWAKRERPALAQQLEVFARICDGMNAAHLRGVIHRDLKPGNILVDEQHEPHVLDFGLAKLAENATESMVSGAMTETGQFVGSLPWASPEQAEGQTDALDIRTDVYSIGVLLFQVLTGQFPYPVAGKLTEVVGHITRTEPVRPSSIDKAIDRELDTIILKCLAKDPDRRYQGAGDIARDLRRYLAGEPVEARRDSLVYVMRKRLARYRVAAIASAAVLAILIAALGVSTVFWRQASRESIRAARAAEQAGADASEARAITEFMREFLTSVEPENQGADVRLVDVLHNASAAAAARFADHPQQEADVRDLLGEIYDQLAMWAEAEAEYALAADRWKRTVGADDPRTLLAESRRIREWVALGRNAKAEEALVELIAREQRVLGAANRVTLQSRCDLAFAVLGRGRVDEAEAMLGDLRALPGLMEDDALQTRLLRGLVEVMHSRLGPRASDESRTLMLAAEPLIVEWIDRATKRFGPEATPTLEAHARLADIALCTGSYAEAAEACRLILERSSGRLSACHPLRAAAEYTLAEALVGLGHYEESAELMLERLDCMRRRFPPGSVMILSSLCDTLRFLERCGPSAAAQGEEMTRELQDGLASFGGGHGELAIIADEFAADFVSIQGRLDEADALFARLFEREEALVGSGQSHARLYLYYAGHLTRRGRFDEAKAALDRAVEIVGDIRMGTWDSHPDDIARAYVMLYSAWSKPEDAAMYERVCAEALHHSAASASTSATP